MGIGAKSGVSIHAPGTPPETLPVHIDSLRRAARGMTRTHEDAEDLVQDTLLKVLARPRQIGPAGAGPYLHQALRNTHVSSLRTRDRRPVLAPLEPEDSRLVAPVRRRAGRDPPHPRGLAAIRSLPQAQREVVAAVDVAGFGYTEAADAAADPGRHRDEPPAPRPRPPRLRYALAA